MRLSLIALVFSFAAVSFGQQKDALLWSGVGIEMGINKRLEFEYESQVRFDQNGQHFAQYYSELGGAFDIGRGFQVGGFYRYARKNSGDYFYNNNRLGLDVSFRFKSDNGLSLKARFRYQHSFDRFKVVNDIAPDRSNMLRLSLKVQYKIKDFKLIQPFANVEFFHAVPPTNQTSFLDTYRFRGGLYFDLPKRQGIKVSYMFEHENRSVDNKNHIYCLEYSYSFKSLHKLKKKKEKDKKKN